MKLLQKLSIFICRLQPQTYFKLYLNKHLNPSAMHQFKFAIMEEMRSKAIAAANALIKGTKSFVFSPKAILFSPKAILKPPTTKPPAGSCAKPEEKCTPPPVRCTPPPPPPADPPKPPTPADVPPPCIETGGGGAAGGSSRAMKYPYTHTAKFFQMPWRFYFANNWHYRYYFYSVILCLPIFKYIQNGMNSPTNVAKWEALQAKDREEQAHHGH